MQKMRDEGKVEQLNKPEHIQSILEMNIAMEEVRREFIVKNFNSEQSAKDVILF